MRTVSFGINISLDGYCDHTLFEPAPEVHDYFTRLMHDADLLFFGRVMYQLMFPYWADVANSKTGAEHEIKFAEKICAMQKVVVSQSLTHAANNTTIVRTNPVHALRALKQQPGGNIMMDSVSLLPAMLNAGLIDEFNLVIHPVIAGKGRLLMPEGTLQQMLVLKQQQTVVFNNGCLAVQYKRV